MLIDVPSPIDLCNIEHAREWESKAMSARPWRTEFFVAFHHQLQEVGAKKVLELGSGPGFLAQALLDLDPTYSYTALDFSAAMHELARKRLGAHAADVQFIERSFKEPNWTEGLSTFDAVVTNQAVHELRHKRYATELHRQVKQLLKTGGIYLVCDHFVGDGGMKNDQLYMTVNEQRSALLGAGFQCVVPILEKGGMVMHRAA